MANVNIELGYKNMAWFTANPTIVLLTGQIVYLEQTGTYKIGDGVSTLSALSFLGVSSEIQTLQNVTDLGNTTTNDIQFDAGVGILLDNTSRLREGTIDAGYGGNKGIAQICAVGYELKWESGSLYVMDGNGTHIRHTLYNFASVPSITEDITKGFLVGTRWSLDNGDLYVCTDNSIGAAVWVLQSSDFTSAEKTKLSGIASGAEVNVNADWNAISGDAEILNKPTIPSIAGLELQANKQNSLTTDGTGVKYPTVDAVNSAITNINTNAVDLITVKLALPINKGQAVYISSANGTNIIVSKASNTSESTSSKTLGLLETTGTTNDIVNVVTDGLLGGLNTSTATIGDPVWLGVTGDLIFGLASKPYAPAHLVYIGVVSRVHAIVGEIIVKVQNGFELNEIHDVDLKSTLPSNNEILTYESSTSLWKNKSVTTALGYTPYNATNPSGYITSSALTGYVPYTGATGNVDLGTYELSTPKLNGSKINLVGTDNALDGIFLSNSTFVNVPNLGVTSNKVSLTARGFSLSNDSAVLTGSFIASFGMGLAVNRSGGLICLKNSTGYSLLVESGNVGILVSNPQTALQVAGNITTTWADSNFGTWYNNGADYRLGFNTIISQRQTNIHAYSVDTGGYITFSTGTNAIPFVNARINPKQTSGSLSNFIFTKPDNTNQTASTSIAGWNYNGGSRQWATGAITTQNENVWGATTYSFVGASTITNAYGNVFNAPIAGTNCTITNRFAALFNNPISLTQTVTTETVVQTRTVTIVINGVTYKLLAA